MPGTYKTRIAATGNQREANICGIDWRWLPAESHKLNYVGSSPTSATMDPIIEVNDKKYLVLRTFPGDRIDPERLKGVPHLRRSDGMIVIVDEIKDAVFEDIIETKSKEETNDNSTGSQKEEQAGGDGSPVTEPHQGV